MNSIHSVLEDHVKDAKCPRCRKAMQGKWRSAFCNAIHYITTTCNHCEYEVFYKADFISSGVDE